jgi:hypothetical protein
MIGGVPLSHQVVKEASAPASIVAVCSGYLVLSLHRDLDLYATGLVAIDRAIRVVRLRRERLPRQGEGELGFLRRRR